VFQLSGRQILWLWPQQELLRLAPFENPIELLREILSDVAVQFGTVPQDLLWIFLNADNTVLNMSIKYIFIFQQNALFE
jgi:hypothetical protein